MGSPELNNKLMFLRYGCMYVFRSAWKIFSRIHPSISILSLYKYKEKISKIQTLFLAQTRKNVCEFINNKMITTMYF